MINLIKPALEQKNRILITGAVLTSSNDLVNTYEKVISWIDNKYEILSPLDTMKFQGNEYEKYERAMQLLKNTKVMIAEMSNVSTGQGMEIQEASTLNIPILVIAKTNSKISSLVKGCKNVKKIIFYDKIEEIKNDILNFIREEINE